MTKGRRMVNPALICAVAMMLADAAGADFSRGLKAYGAGDFAGARSQWEAAKGENRAMAHYRLGLMLVHGTGVKAEPDTGLAWLRQSANGGLRLAQLDLAQMLFTGQDLSRDYQEALRWALSAANSDSALARYYLGRHHDRGLGVALDYHAALKHFRFAAARGIPQAQRRLGQYISAGIATEPDPDGALEWIQRAAMAGDGEAQYDLVRRYHFGRGLDKGLNAARKYYDQAARGGHAKAQHDLAMFHIQGLAGEVDFREGRFWLQRAAATGIAQSQFQLGELELTDLAHPLLLYEAFEWIGKSWRQNFKDSHELIAKLARDLPERLAANKPRDRIDSDATVFCLLAHAASAWPEIDRNCGEVARFNQVVAQYVMGRVNEYGLGRPKNPGRAYQWYRRAAKGGLPRAQNAFGRLLMRGLGARPTRPVGPVGCAGPPSRVTPRHSSIWALCTRRVLASGNMPWRRPTVTAGPPNEAMPGRSSIWPPAS